MATKLMVTITKDENGSDSGMVRTLGLLGSMGLMPLDKVTIAVVCENEDAEAYKDDLHAILSGRPVGIDALIKTTQEERIERERLNRVTPLDSLLAAN